MRVFFVSVKHFVHFWVCGLLCSTYFIAVFMSGIFVLGKKFSNKQLLYTNIYSQLMSIPLMPFVLHLGGFGFSTTVISLYALSNFIWQCIFLTNSYGTQRKSFIIELSLCNLAGWTVMALANYWFYGRLITFF